MIVDGDQSRIMVFAQLAQDVSLHTAHDPTDVFGDHQINASRPNKLPQFLEFFPVEAFSTADRLNHDQLVRKIGAGFDPASIKRA